MDEVLAGPAWRIDAPTLQDRHPVLHPQHRLARAELREQEPRPAAVTRVRGEQLGQGTDGRNGRLPSPAQPAGELANFGRAVSTVFDEGKACCQTPHNADVLLLFFVLRLSAKS